MMEELLELTRQNNHMLREILAYIHRNKRDDNYDFMSNVVANLISERIEERRKR